MANFQTVIFDCDGVMFDTENVNRAYYNTLLGRFGMPDLTGEQFRNVHMFTVAEALLYLFDGKVDMDAVRKAASEISYDTLVPHMRMDPFLMPVLQKIKPACFTAICTNRSTTMPLVMRHFGLSPWFDMVVTSLDVAHAKPHPESLLKIMDAAAAPPESAVYLGDSSYDQEAAEAAGIPFIACNNRALTAIHHLDGLERLPEILGV